MSTILDGSIILMSDQPGSTNHNNLDELKRDGTYVQTISINPPYEAFYKPLCLASRSAVDPAILVCGKDSSGTKAIFKISRAGVASDFIPHSAIADLLTTPYTSANDRPSGLAVDDLDRIYLVQKKTNGGTATIRRFLSNGTFDQDFNALVDQTTSPVTTFFGGWDNISDWGYLKTDGSKYYTTEIYNVGGGVPKTHQRHVLEYDLTAGMAVRRVIDYTELQGPTTVDFAGTELVPAIEYDPRDDSLWISNYYLTYRHNTTPATQEVHALLDHVDVATGSIINTYDIGALAGDWDGSADGFNAGSTTNQAGLVQFLHFDPTQPHILWGQLLYEGQLALLPIQAKTVFFRLNTNTGAVQFPHGFADLNVLVDFPFLIYLGGTDDFIVTSYADAFILT